MKVDLTSYAKELSHNILGCTLIVSAALLVVAGCSWAARLPPTTGLILCLVAIGVLFGIYVHLRLEYNRGRTYYERGFPLSWCRGRACQTGWADAAMDAIEEAAQA